jgi:hypothetical protein
VQPESEMVTVGAGKHWNAMRECGKPVVRPLPANTHIGAHKSGGMQAIHSPRNTGCHSNGLCLSE